MPSPVIFEFLDELEAWETSLLRRLIVNNLTTKQGNSPVRSLNDLGASRRLSYRRCICRKDEDKFLSEADMGVGVG